MLSSSSDSLRTELVGNSRKSTPQCSKTEIQFLFTKQLDPYKNLERCQLKEVNKTGDRMTTKKKKEKKLKKEQYIETEENVS